jgi:BirA family transcriptional regulator, biotin operon repressor / biotin---[acetyl-CoA-carboxylase] ligase
VIAYGEGFVDPDRWAVLENLISLVTVPSSNGLGRELIELYFDEDQTLRTTVLLAESQPEAYGRNGRAWSAPPGRGLYLTILLRPAGGDPLSLMPIAAARWAAEVLRETTGVSVELKWPNDLYCGRNKLAGVIAESRTQGEDTYVALGIGINVAGAGAELGVENATTLEEQAGRSLDRAALMQALLDRFDRELAAPRWSEEVRAWERASLHRPGDRLTVRRNGEEVTGQYLGLDPSGFLRLRTESGEAIVSSGEVAAW